MSKDLRLPKTNIIIIAGRLTRDIEIKHTASGVAVANLSLAFDRSYKKDNEWVQESSFIDVIVWKERAEKCAGQLHKGSPILVEGYLKTRTYQDKENRNVKITEIVANKVSFLEKGESQSESNPAPSNQVNGDVTDDDVPF